MWLKEMNESELLFEVSKENKSSIKTAESKFSAGVKLTGNVCFVSVIDGV